MKELQPKTAIEQICFNDAVELLGKSMALNKCKTIAIVHGKDLGSVRFCAGEILSKYDRRVEGVFFELSWQEGSNTQELSGFKVEMMFYGRLTIRSNDPIGYSEQFTPEIWNYEDEHKLDIALHRAFLKPAKTTPRGKML